MAPLRAFCLAACVGLAGCHQPMVTPKPPTFQSSEVTVRDWKNAAHDVASELESVGLVPSQWQPAATNGGLRPIYVLVSEGDSIFLREAADELQGDILRRGGTIANTAMGATVVTLDVDVVRWAPGDLFPSNTEAVLNASVEIDGALKMKLVEPVYVRNGDVALYMPPKQRPLATRILHYEP